MPHTSNAGSAKRGGGIMSLILAIAGLTVIGSVGYVFFPRPGMQPVAVERGDLELTLYRVGLKPEFLSAAGVSASQTRSIVSKMRAHLSTTMPALEAADNACEVEQNEVTQLHRIVRTGKGSDQQVRDLAAAKASLATSETERDSMLNAAFAAATESLSTEQVATLANLRKNGRKWQLPVEYLVVNRTDGEWVNLRNALSNERISERLDREPDGDAQALLGRMRSHAAVAAARQGISNLAAVETAWNEAVAAE